MSSFRIFPDRDTSIIVVSASPRPEWFAKVGDNAAMSASMNADSDITLFRQDLVALKRDVASLTEHMKGGETVRILRQQAGAEGGQSTNAVSLFIEKQALVVLSLAVAFGYIGARVFRR
jgi:hypothetical protein